MEKDCKYHGKPLNICSCLCTGCGNYSVDCICRFMDGVFEDEVSLPRPRAITDLTLALDPKNKRRG